MKPKARMTLTVRDGSQGTILVILRTLYYLYITFKTFFRVSEIAFFVNKTIKEWRLLTAIILLKIIMTMLDNM